MKRRVFFSFGLGLIPGCSKTETLTLLTGQAFGTAWSMKTACATKELKGPVQGKLDEWESIFSLWQADSVLMRWNESGSTEWQAVPVELAEAARFALDLAEKTSGAFNPTLAPELRRAGFLPPRLGKEGGPVIPPAERWRMMEARLEPPALRKAEASLQLDLNAVVEGFALDALTVTLEGQGVKTFLLELGGEFSARGLWQGKPWPVAVESPLSDSPPVAVVELRDEALSTSGIYRQHRGTGETWETHVRNGRTGAAAGNKLLTVSVRHPQAMAADGWATALLAAGPQEGLELARKNQLSALFILANGPGPELTLVKTGGF